MNIRATKEIECAIKSQGNCLIFEHSSGSIAVPVKALETAIKRHKEGKTCVD